MSLKVNVTRNHNFSSGLVTRAALNAGATPTVSLTGSVDTAEIADASITNAKVAANAAISLSKLGDLDAGYILTGGGDYPVATSLLSSTKFGNTHHSVSNPSTTYKATMVLGTDTAATTAVMSGDAELQATGALHINPTFVDGKSALAAQSGTVDDSMIADTDNFLVVDYSENPTKFKKISLTALKSTIDTTSVDATEEAKGVMQFATYNQTYTGVSGYAVSPNNIGAHQCVPVGWVVLRGTETAADHSTRRTDTTTSNPVVDGNRSHNFVSATKTGCGTYSITFSNCPSSNLMLMATLTSWGWGTTSATKNEVIPMGFEQTTTGSGGSSTGANGTVSFATHTGYTVEGVANNFQFAHLVLYAT